MTFAHLQAAAQGALEAAFGRGSAMHVQAPGRVNLIGEHTDYNGGFVLPCAIDRGTVVAIRARADEAVRVVAVDMQQARDTFSLGAPILPRSDAEGGWTHCVRGCIAQLRARGWPIGGADLAIAGNVPRGAGLSSSASLSLAMLQAFKTAFGLHALTPTEMARIGQYAENHFAGCACGMMDPLASAHGRSGHALLIDCRSFDVKPVRMPEGIAVMIVHSGVKRGLVDSEYNLRREQCEAAARWFGVPALRDVPLAGFEQRSAGLDDLLRRRARHVVSDSARALASADALAAGDMPTLGRLMRESHASMRDDFEITEPSVDRLAEVLGDAIGDAGGARMTGGGFGGCVVALLPHSRLDQATQAVASRYRAPDGQPAAVIVCQPSGGAGPIG